MTPDLVRRILPDLKSVSPLGSGGQKVVFSAEHPTDGPVVLKLIKPGQNPERVTRELRAAQEITSPRIPALYELGSALDPSSPGSQILWIREQRIEGRTLFQHLQTIGTVDFATTHSLVIQMLEALAAAETANIVHRDVKPGNIIVTPSYDFFLLDFGYARHLDLESATATGAFGVGTPGYAPPEQYRNLKTEIDSRTDLFGLGVTTYEAHAGYNPFRQGARDIGEICRRIENSSHTPLAISGDQSGELSGLVNTMLKARRDHRPSSVAEALDWARSIGP